MIRNPVPWPDRARCAAAITFDVDTDSILHLEHRRRGLDMLSTMSWLKYDEIAVPRILDMFREFGLKQTFFYPAWCMKKAPHLVEMILEDGHEIAAHGYIHEDPNKQSPNDERRWLERQIEVIREMTGQRPRGWRAPLYNASRSSPELLIEEGMSYDASLMGDDVPYILKMDGGDLVEIPSHWAMDDWPHYAHSIDMNYLMPIKSPDEAMRVFMSEFEAMYEYGGAWVTVWHPFVSGRLARCHRIKQMIEEMLSKGSVWFATMEEIADHVRKCIDDGSWSPRVDELPYYEESIPELAWLPPK